MKTWMATTAALALLAGISVANAQNAPAGTFEKSDKTMKQSASPKPHMRAHQARVNKKIYHRASTTGAGSRVGPIGGPRNDPSIHQSIGRDSRGTPKGEGEYK
jgi:hypothetical protein